MVCLFLYLVVCLQQNVARIDINTAFLNGVLTGDVWVVSPRGISGRLPKVYKLNKVLYGLKLAHFTWRAKLCEDWKK